MSILDDLLSAQAPKPGMLPPPAATAPVPAAPVEAPNKLREVLRLAVPALLMGMAARRDGLSGVGAVAGGTSQGMLHNQQMKQRRQEFSERQRDRDELQAQRVAVADENRRRWEFNELQQQEQQRAQAKAKLDSLVRTAIENAAENPNFMEMVNATGAKQYTIPVNGTNVPLDEALQFIGTVKGPDGKYMFGKGTPAPKEPEMVTHTYEDPKTGNTMEDYVTKEERRRRGATVRSIPTPKEPKEPKLAKVTTVRVRRIGDDDVVSVSLVSGDSIDMTADEVYDAIKAKKGVDPTPEQVKAAMRSAAAMEVLVK